MSRTLDTRQLRAALAMSALLPGDRAWVIGHLAPEMRQRLDEALTDLDGRSVLALADTFDEPPLPGQELEWLTGRVPALAHCLARMPETLWPRFGKVLGSELRQRVLVHRASGTDAAAARHDPLAACWTSLPGDEAPALDEALLLLLVFETGRCAPATSPQGCSRSRRWWPWRRKG